MTILAPGYHYITSNPDEEYTQVEARASFGYVDTVWIPTRAARVGEKFRVRDLGGERQLTWTVTQVFGTRPRGFLDAVRWAGHAIRRVLCGGG
jgi:hypothetical protein